MSKLFPITLLSLGVVFSSIVQANEGTDNGFYIGATYNNQSISVGDRDYKTAGIVGGYDFNKYFALEARYSKGISGYDNDSLFTNFDYKEDINYQISLAAKASYYFTADFKVYGMLGYSDTELKIATIHSNYIDDVHKSTIAAKVYEKENGLSVGIGVSYNLSEQLSVFLDHQRLPSLDVGSSSQSYRWDSTTLGVTYSF